MESEKIKMRKLKPRLPNYLIKRKIYVIRQKIILRKYGIIYLQKVFGKYYPSECLRYHKKRILRKYFDKLRIYWFEEKVHRLLNKAKEFHDKQQIRKCFIEWHGVVKKGKLIKHQELILRSRHGEILSKYILLNWKLKTEFKKRYKMIRNTAIEIYCLMKTLIFFLMLKEYFCREIEESLIEIKFILRGRWFILRKFYRKWKNYPFQQKNKRILQAKAANNYELKMKKFYFSQWKKYVCYKHTKQDIVDICRGLYHDGLIKIVVRIWKNQTRSKIIEKKNMILAIKFYNKFTKRRLLKTWRRYVRHKLRGRSLKHKADFFYAMKLKQRSLNVLSKHVTNCKNTKLAIQKLKLFYKRLIITNVWNQWTKMIDERNDYELRHKFLLAKSFYRENIIRKYLAIWKSHKILRKKNKDLLLKAFDLCRSFYCKKFFNTWKLEYMKKRRVAILQEKALQFLNEFLQRDAISRWIAAYNRRITLAANYEKSVSHYHRNILNKCFTSWIIFCNQKIREDNLNREVLDYYLDNLKRKILNRLSMNVVRTKMEHRKINDADNFYRKNLMMKAFTDWRKKMFRLKEFKNKLKNFDERSEKNLKRKIIMQWKLYLNRKKCSRRKKLMSITHVRKKICLKIFGILKRYVIYKKAKRIGLSHLSYGVESIEQNIKSLYFQKWRMAQLNVLKDKCKMFHAIQFHESTLKQRYFSLFQTFLVQRRIKQRHQCNLNDIINNFILEKFLKIWYTRYKTSLKNHFNENYVSKIYEMKIRHKYFIAWKYFAEICVREKKEINDAKKLHEKLIIKEGLRYLIKRFLRNTELKFETRLKNVEQSSSKGFELLRKYFNTWHRIVITQVESRSYAIKNQMNIENVVPVKEKINDSKYVSDLIPRFIIPDFMKKEIKLRFGIAQRSNKMTFDYNGEKLLKNVRLLKMTKPFKEQESKRNVLCSRADNNSRGNNESRLNDKSVNNFTRLQNLRLDTKVMSNDIGILSPDSLKSDLDSGRTYIVQNSVDHRNLGLKDSFSYSHRHKLLDERHNENNNYKLIPPAAFYVSLKK